MGPQADDVLKQLAKVCHERPGGAGGRGRGKGGGGGGDPGTKGVLGGGGYPA
jgi:hypothetical protein